MQAVTSFRGEDFVEIKGHSDLRLGVNGIENLTTTVEQELSKCYSLPEAPSDAILKENSRFSVNNLYDGLDFAEAAKAGTLSDCSGYVANVFVDDFVSNIRLSDFDLSPVRFGVSYDFWCDYCKEHKVKVDWVNR